MTGRRPQWSLVFLVVLCGMHIVASPAAAACQADDTTLCLNGSRFSVTAAWQTTGGATGMGHAVPLTADTGYFWFFNSTNAEVVVKVLNGCAVNQRYWVFAAGLTNVKVTLTAFDHGPGNGEIGRLPRWTSVNPLNTPFQPVQATDAFNTCN